MNINEKKMNIFYGCQKFIQGVTCEIRTLIRNKTSISDERIPTALVINTLQSADGVRKFLSHYELVSVDDFQRLFIRFDNYKIPIFIVIEDLYSKAVRLTDCGELVDVQLSLLMAETHQPLPKMNRSAFYGTDLDKDLNKLGIKKIIFTGEMTHASLAATRRDAELLGYHAGFARNIITIDDKLTKAKYSVNGAKNLMAT